MKRCPEEIGPRGVEAVSAISRYSAWRTRAQKPGTELRSDSNSLGCECARGGPTASQHLLISGHRGSDTAQVGGSDSQLHNSLPGHQQGSGRAPPVRAAEAAIWRSVGSAEARLGYTPPCPGSEARVHNPLSGFSQGQVHDCVTRHNTPSPQRFRDGSCGAQLPVRGGRRSTRVQPLRGLLFLLTGAQAEGLQDHSAAHCSASGAGTCLCTAPGVRPCSGGLSAASGVAGAGGALPL